MRTLANGASAIPLTRMDNADPALMEELLDAVEAVARSGAFTGGAEGGGFGGGGGVFMPAVGGPRPGRTRPTPPPRAAAATRFDQTRSGTPRSGAGSSPVNSRT